MENLDFDKVSPAIWLVFGGSYLNHDNAPCAEFDKREQLLVDLLSSYLNSELSDSNAEQIYGPTLTELADVHKLLELWSHDLELLYKMRGGSNVDSLVRQTAQRFLERVKTFENCTIIPNGLILAQHTHDVIKEISGCHDHVNLAILKKRNSLIDWVQVNPGCAYHQSCPSLAGDKSNAFFEITDVDPDNVTEDWLYLLVGLKAVKPGDIFHYKDVSLYENLLVHLNGKTVFQSEPDEGFVASSPISPVHTWQVVDQSFRYLLQHFIGETYHAVYRKLLTGFKLFLMQRTFSAYQDVPTQQHHFLLQEMCRDVAQQAIDLGNEEQKAFALKLIKEVKAGIAKRCSQQESEVLQRCRLDEPDVSSLSFVAPNLTKHNPSSSDSKLSSLKVDPVLVKPSPQDDIVDYLRQFQRTFVDELMSSDNLNKIALLSYGIEIFFIDYLAMTDIFQITTRSPFSKDDTYVATVLKKLGECYYSCQAQLVNGFLSNLTYQPHFFAKNVIIQFFVYAAVAALNFRVERMGLLLAEYNLCVAMSDSLSFHEITPHLVIQDRAWLKVLITLKAFFMPEKGKNNLFSYCKFQDSYWLNFQIGNDAEKTDIDVGFALKLLERDHETYTRFINDHRHLDDEKFNRKWQRLAYTDDYLPSIYGLLSKVAHFAKVSLTGFPSKQGKNSSKADWSFSNSEHRHRVWLSEYRYEYKEYWRSQVAFKINNCEVRIDPSSKQLASYLLTSDKDPYQRLIICKENICKPHSHLSENEIIASQDKKPNTLDRIRYMQLGFLQSKPLLKLERLYIALKEQQLDFSREQESVLIKQTLFEVSIFKKMDNGFCSLLEWTVHQNPSLIHKLGLLCIEKARAMQYRLTQHQAIGHILEVILGLLTFYPLAHKDEFIEGIADIYHLLKEILERSTSNLGDLTLLHLNAYLIISVQGKPELLETETLTVLNALLAIQNYKAKAVELDNDISLRVHSSSYSWCSWIENNLGRDSTLLNNLMVNVIPQWDQTSLWQKSKSGLLFTCNDHAVKPLLGGVYFQNQPVVGLPDTITDHRVFKEYLGRVSFTVIPGSYEIDNRKAPCYLSVDHVPQMRLALIQNALLIEEFIENDYQRYIPAEELLGHHNYPRLLYQSPGIKEKLRHWLKDNQEILVKDHKRNIIYRWDLESKYLFSCQHQGYVVPWDQLKGPSFKTWLNRIELPTWIEIIAQPNSNNLVQIQSLHFPRLGLHFDLKQSKFCCRQIHGYTLAEQQHINTLHGFQNYLILERKELNSSYRVTKVIIPHLKVKPDECFAAKTLKADFSAVESPTYFVYDYDPKTGLLKAHHTRAQLYLALLYYCSASLDDHDVSNCNAYHLAREILEVCWKDQPFDEVELSIIERFLSPGVMRDFHSNRIALYLKVVSLLSSSLRLAFLYTDEKALQSRKESDELLRKCRKYLPFLLLSYLENKSTIFARIRLGLEEEEDVTKQCLLKLSVSQKSEEPEKSRILSLISTLKAYCQLHFEQQPQVVMSAVAKKSYKNHYAQLFSKEALKNTSFLYLLKENLAHFSLVHDKDVNFLSGFDGILLDRFRLNNFIPLFKLAKSSCVSLAKYRYLLHHMVFRAKVNYDRFPAVLVMMLARALLLVAENPSLFPQVPSWFGTSKNSVELKKRSITRIEVFGAFPEFSFSMPSYDNEDEKLKALRKKYEAQKKYDEENEQIWTNLCKYDLDSRGIPLRLPDTPTYFTLPYESHLSLRNWTKEEVVKRLYLEAAYNDAMYQFFKSVLELCDEQKYGSTMGWSITSFDDNPIKVAIEAEVPTSPIPEPVSLEKWALPQEPLIPVHEFFNINTRSVQNAVFLFESQLEKPDNAYQGHFYQELKDSWLAYHKETEVNYSLISDQGMSKLECVLQTKYDHIREQAERTWQDVSAQLKQQPNSESDNYFALRWYSGQVPHFHKGDVLKLLVEPHKLASHNPDCSEKHDSIIRSLLNYVNCEINAAKIIRVLAFIEQYKRTDYEEEQFSMLQGLVRNLQETVDPVSYRYPHWFLFQLENEIIVRENQRELIEAMLNQTEKAMYQLNMGEGKSSVILPLLSNNLANGQQVLRINVLSALLITMKNFLRQRFSGLIRKRVYTLPFHRDTDISPEHLMSIFQALQTCQRDQHILLVTPEHRLCLQLKVRELMLENQKQIGATDVFNWQTYRQRVPRKIEVYKDLTESEMEQLLAKQDESLRTCLCDEKYIDSNNKILKVPPRGQGRKEFARFKDTVDNQMFREWGCLKAAYRELLYNSKLAHEDSTKKLALLYEINELTSIDLLDESDEILRHGTELNYTMGDKHMFAGGELRWQIPQFFIKAILCDLDVRDVIASGKGEGFTVLNLHYSSQGGVPFVQLLDHSYFENSIKPLLLQKFFLENSPTLRKYQVDEDTPLVKGEMSSLRHYIAGQLPLNTEKNIMAFLADKGPLKDKVLIAKGWLSHGILFHVFNAKYRVQYGLNLHFQGQTAKPIAIPFMGKDAPSPRSEFSHPDVMLGFTIVSYLYEGLSQQQLKETLTRLKNEFSHQVADARLQEWAEASRAWIEPKTDSFPPLLLTSLKHMDFADEQCLEKVHLYLSGNHLAILFYLNQFILLQEAMQFLYKISANAHSLVGYDAALGFSGTDDRKLTMPFQVKSLRSVTQEGTNGKLLSVLTQERNSQYYSLQIEDTNTLLERMCQYISEKPNCHALIDAGALVTGLTNFEAASFILNNLPTNFLGVLYFSDEGNSLTVLTRDNKTLALQDCYLDKQNLFAYLDDVHTRGTDIKLPLNCHAILTIGMGMEKDKLMQAAMRLRQLAQKQSVSLWGTQAVTLAIARDNPVDPAKINSFEVIKWVTRNTIEHINSDLFPVAVRKINFQFSKKAEAWLREAPTTLDSLVQHCQDKEVFSLEDFYGLTPQRQDLADRLFCLVPGRIRTFWQDIEEELQSKQLTQTAFYKKVFNSSDKKFFRKQLDTICNEFEAFLGTGYIHSCLDNDEEKEVEVEIIQEQEVLIKVENRKACSEQTWDVRLILNQDFVSLAEDRNIIMPLSRIRHFIQMPADLKNIIWHSDLFMTANFINSVESKPDASFDNYLRPVDVMLIHRFKSQTMVILLSGHEAAQIKSTCFQELDDNNLLIHLNDIDGPTQYPTDSNISKHEEKVLTIIKLFSGECQYSSSKEVLRLAKRVGRLYPEYFVRSDMSIDDTCSRKLYGILIDEGYLDFSGVMTKKLIKILDLVKSGESPALELMSKCQPHYQYILNKLYQIYTKLVVQPSNSLKENHNTLRQWVGTCGRFKEYIGSALESIVNSEYQLKC